MTGHAAAAEWLQTLPWWDWRGWSDWFYGGQAIGVNYPPLGHAWMRFTDPVHGQIAAVALGSAGAVAVGHLCAWPGRWGTRRGHSALRWGRCWCWQRLRARCTGFSPASISKTRFFGSWPAMIATVIGLYMPRLGRRAATDRWRAEAVVGVAVLFNATVVPGVLPWSAPRCWLQAAPRSANGPLRWGGNRRGRGPGRMRLVAGAVPGSARPALVRWEVSLAECLALRGGTWQADDPGRGGSSRGVGGPPQHAGPSRRLAFAALAGLMALLCWPIYSATCAPSAGWSLPILVAAMAAAGLVADTRLRPRFPAPGAARLGCARRCLPDRLHRQ